MDDTSLVPTIRRSSIETKTEKKEDGAASVVPKESGTSIWTREGSVNKPRVKDLKSFYDHLTERSKEEMMVERQRTGSIKMITGSYTCILWCRLG